jgi:hypothetical protein
LTLPFRPRSDAAGTAEDCKGGEVLLGLRAILFRYITFEEKRGRVD